ncbi:50S ribosome-binding GTPase [Streptomyces phaeofaciens JCM 4814]|uniref:GTPase n=1 Tax=Streptomyces phaeofaciens TaxID=68254 RepID=A0A918HLC8_9ACTN|nr:dynamin family protein [Streptomyces phaeofaciens]GGT78161.1 GTPase [Streptomyces phaeofaciens]
MNAASTSGPEQGELCTAVARLVGTALAALPPGTAPGPEPGSVVGALEAVRDRLAEGRLRIAVGGRMNAGKSTLVNALLGQRLAATDATECTTVVAWFRRGVQNKVRVRRLDGRAYDVPAHPGGGIPRDPGRLGSPPEEIAELLVDITSSELTRRHILIDTPGMDTLSGLDDVALRALAQADALLYVMPHPGAGDAEALQSLRRQAGPRMTAMNVLGVLSRIDELGTGTGPPWPRARRVAATYATRLTGMVSHIVPVVGLLAQTAGGDEFTEDDTALLRRLTEVPRESLEEALYSPEEFAEWADGPLDKAGRLRLLDLLGAYGIALAVDLLTGADGGPAVRGTGALLDRLRAASGLDALVREIQARFVSAADRLRAASALQALDDLALAVPGATADPAVRDTLAALRSDVAALRRHPLLRQTELGSALAELASGTLSLGDADAAALVALATGTDAAACLRLPPDAPAHDIARTAAEAAAGWRVREASGPRPLRRHARTARELCEEFHFRSAERAGHQSG